MFETLQTNKPTLFRVAAFVLAASSAWIALAGFLYGVLAGCVLLNGQPAPEYLSQAFWIHSYGGLVFMAGFLPLGITLVSFVWVFSGANARQLLTAFALLIGCVAVLAVHRGTASKDWARMILPGTANCGDAL